MGVVGYRLGGASNRVGTSLFGIFAGTVVFFILTWTVVIYVGTRRDRRGSTHDPS